MSSDGKNNHRNGHREPSRDGVVFDVMNKFVFDTLGVMFESESEAWKSDTDAI